MSMFGGGFGGFSNGGGPGLGGGGGEGEGGPFPRRPRHPPRGGAALEAREPAHGDPRVSFEPGGDSGTPVTLRRLVTGPACWSPPCWRSCWRLCCCRPARCWSRSASTTASRPAACRC